MAKFYTPTKISENIHETPEGYLVCVGVPVARTGVQIYAKDECPLEVGPDGTVKVTRDAKEVFHPRTIASFQGKPVTIKHPEDFVAPHNWQELARGIVQNVRKGEGLDEDGEEFLEADLLITEELAIQLVKNGLREVSCGYEAEYEQTGEGEGRQLKIVGNHIALVEQGRAGQSYAINDHKGKSTMSKLAENLKKLFGKAVDEAMAEENKAKDEDKKEDKAKDEDKKDDKESKDSAAYDELVKMCKDLGAKIDAMGKGKDEAKEDKKDEKKDDAKDEEEGEKSMEERMKALELAVSKLLEGKVDDEDEEESESEDEKEEESEDDDFEESDMTGDTAARVEILAPGLKAKKGEDVRKQALETSYATAEGKALLEKIAGGKKPTFDSAENVNLYFVAASELLKAARGTGLERTKNPKAFSTDDAKSEVMTPEKLNQINAAHWAK